jgi:2-oxoacid:acceptor oxidoreductase delta subunit (pyruvate/2-ketoisovalerate family)
MGKISFGACNPVPGSSKENKTGDWRTMRPEIDYDICTKKCFFCWEFCPDSAITRTKDGPKINYVYCKGCGICAFECKKNAIKMSTEEK